MPKSAAKRKRKRDDKGKRPSYKQDGEGTKLHVRRKMPHVAQEYQQVNGAIAASLVTNLRPRYQIAVLGALAKGDAYVHRGGS